MKLLACLRSLASRYLGLHDSRSLQDTPERQRDLEGIARRSRVLKGLPDDAPLSLRATRRRARWQQPHHVRQLPYQPPHFDDEGEVE